MARSRFNAWAAYTDLFGGLLIVALAVLVLSQAELLDSRKKFEDIKRTEELRSIEEKKLNTLFERLRRNLKGKSAQRVDEPCSRLTELCIDVDFKFISSRDDLSAVDLALLNEVGADLGKTLEGEEENVEILVEGHTDASLPRNVAGRDLYRYNWDLSAKRASSVMYELSRRDLGVFRMRAQGRANSDRRCEPVNGLDYQDPECGRRNRRTTLKILYNPKRGSLPQ